MMSENEMLHLQSYLSGLTDVNVKVLAACEKQTYLVPHSVTFPLQWTGLC